MLQLLAGGKQHCQKGISLCKPFFFLLVDSVLESFGLAAGFALLLESVPLAVVGVGAGSAAGATEELSGVVTLLPPVAVGGTLSDVPTDSVSTAGAPPPALLPAPPPVLTLLTPNVKAGPAAP